MKRAKVWFWMSCKRYLHRVSFLVVLLILPAAAFFIRNLEKREGTRIRIAVCIGQDGPAMGQVLGEAGQDGPVMGQVLEEAGQDGPAMGQVLEKAGQDGFGQDQEPWGQAPLEQEVLQDLVSRKETEGMFRFYYCESEEEVEAEVASRRAECGYVIAPGLRQKLDEKDYKRSIRVYSAPSTVTAELSAEVVFAALARRYDRDLFLQYVESGDAFAPLRSQVQVDGLLEESGALYDAWAKDGGTFRFVYELVSAAPAGNKEGGDGAQAMLFPVRGIVSVYVFVAGLYGAAISLMDEKKGLYHALSVPSRIPCQIASVMGPVALAALSGFAALLSGGCMGQPWREGILMAGYVLAVTGFSWLLGQICRREAAVCCLIPFFLIGSMVFCPVIVDVSRYIPALAAAGKWFLPWYYLKLF